MNNEALAVQGRISARESAQTLLNRITAWVTLGSLAGVGAFAYLAATTIPGAAASTVASSSTPSATTSGNPTSSGSTYVPPLQASSGSVSSSPSSGVAVSGGSH